MKTTLFLLLFWTVVFLSSCTLHIDSDGSKSATVDGVQFLKTLTILAEK